ncbi:MAG: hypothetical protein KDC15_07450 [Chitinophagaceae bacterium]|nr:hypothetical protein [Chitinophagaceae bacterium]
MKRFILNGLVLLLSFYTKAQNSNSNNFQKMVDFLPPAPNAAAIIKHAEFTINKNTGSPSLNIPLFEVKGQKLSTSISLGYSSNGIKVDEIASRVGMGWSLNAGGVITRIVRGNADENTTRLVPVFAEAQQNCGTYSFMERITSSSLYSGFDSEPDLFNFNMNGISGSFVFDENMNPVLIPADKLKIEKSFFGTAWNFKITNTDGVIYYFGGNGATEKTKTNSTCGKNFFTPVPTSWYLTKIEHPNGEVINLSYTPLTYTYETGVSETRHWSWFIQDRRDVPVGASLSCPMQDCPSAPASTTCINRLTTQGVLLKYISSAYDSVIFEYANNRYDCEDKLVSSVKKYVNNQVSGIFNLTYNQQLCDMQYANSAIYAYGYNYTPYLVDLTENSPDYAFSRTHKFIYNDPAARPNRLSFSQDHWGYFNGKMNSVFIPKPTELYLQSRFPAATANREPDPFYAKKGMLSKIVYPTGGIDTLEYEANEVMQYIPQYNTYHEYDCNVTGTGYWDEVVKTTTFTIDQPQIVELDINSSTINLNEYDPVHQKGTVTVNNGTSFSWSESFAANATPYIRYLNPTWNLPAGTYTVTYSAKGSSQTLSLKIKYYPKTYTSSSHNNIVGGLRVKRIMTGNPNEKPIIKRYFYGSMDQLSISSLYSVQKPVYVRDYENAIRCNMTVGGGNSAPVNVYCQLMAMYSNSLENLFNYGSAPVSYAYVVESIGDNFEGGAIQNKFYASSNSKGYVWNGHEIIGAPLNNSSSPLNGKLREETVFKKSANGNLFPIKKTTYDYILEERAYKRLYGYNVNKRYEIAESVPGIPCANNSSVVTDKIINSYDVMRYIIESWWAHLNYKTETNYDENGQNPNIITTNYYFDNEQHFQQTRTEATNSKGQVIRTTIQYPGDITGQQVYTDMVSKNIITPVIHSTSEILNNPSPNIALSEEKINYSNTGNNNFVPISVQKAVKGNALEIEGTIDAYDAKGNILQFTNKAGIVTSLVWGYNYRYPVANVIGATYSTVIAQLTNGSVNALQSMDGSSLRNELNKIRTNLTNARVTSYTYKPMAGITSITDPNNKTNSYTYDSFNQLLTILDQDNNVVKKNNYVYTNPNSNSTLQVYFNNALTKVYTCQTCEQGYVASPVNFLIRKGKYYSLISQADADNQANADTEGQEYANKNAICINNVTATCSGIGYKVVNCECQLGTKVCQSSTQNGNGTYTVTYYYSWGDGTTSLPETYTETFTCNGIDKKVINCSCETGQKVCDNVQNNGGGVYTVTYHYRWSDNSTSAQITETITCSGVDKKIINCVCETGVKQYISSVLCPHLNPPPGCCTNGWLCTFRYRWSDGSVSSNTYTECSPTNCLPSNYDN